MAKKRAAIYHFTDKSQVRPKIYNDQIDALRAFSISKGFDTTDIFCDKTLKRSNRTEFDRFLSSCDQYDALITKDFYHISLYTRQCMEIMRELRTKGIQILTTENGTFDFQEEPFEEPLRVATYYSRFGNPNHNKQIAEVHNDILRLFTEKKTNWTLIDQYLDESTHQVDSEYKCLQSLIDNKDKYDLLVIHNLNDIHHRTAHFCKVRETLKLDIYSLQDGFLKYRH